MENTGCQNCVCLSTNQSLIKVLQAASTATGNHWHGYCLGDSTGKFNVIPGAMTIGINTGKQ